MSKPERSEPAGEEKGLEWSKVLPLNSVYRCSTENSSRNGSACECNWGGVAKDKLIATGREPKSVQVLISMSECGEESLGLQDEAGVFVEVAIIVEQSDAVTVVETMPIVGERESGSERDEDVEELKHSLQVATEENRSLKEELTAQQIYSENS